MNQIVNKKNYDSSNSFVLGLWPQIKIRSLLQVYTYTRAIWAQSPKDTFVFRLGQVPIYQISCNDWPKNEHLRRILLKLYLKFEDLRGHSYNLTSLQSDLNQSSSFKYVLNKKLTERLIKNN